MIVTYQISPPFSVRYDKKQKGFEYLNVCDSPIFYRDFWVKESPVTYLTHRLRNNPGQRKGMRSIRQQQDKEQRYIFPVGPGRVEIVPSVYKKGNFGVK